MKVDLVKVVNLDKKYKDKNGNVHTSVNYYIVTDDKQYVAIRPAFGTGYPKLDVLSSPVKNGTPKESSSEVVVDDFTEQES